MTYSEKKIKEFVKELSSSSPTPGGGSASALVGSIAASLIVMDCNLTLGKEAYKSVSRQVGEIKRRAAKLSSDLLRCADRDARSFETVMRAISMPKNTELQKLKRFEKVQGALKKATEVPLEIMMNCTELESMAKFMSENGNKSSRSDAVVGGILANAALKGAYENLEINLESIKDENFVEYMNRKALDLLKSPAQFVR